MTVGGIGKSISQLGKFTYSFYIICLLKYFHIKIFARVKQKIIYLIPCEHRQFWQLSQLHDFSINAVVNLFIPERLKIPEAHSEPSQTSKMELFAEMVNS